MCLHKVSVLYRWGLKVNFCWVNGGNDAQGAEATSDEAEEEE